MKKLVFLFLLISNYCFSQNAVLMNSNGQAYIGKLSDVTSSSLTTSGTAPAITLAAGTGLGATASIIGNNVAGKITLNTGTTLLATGKIMTLAFSGSFSYPNGCFITFVPGDANFAPFMTKLYAVSSTTGVDLYVITTALSISTTYTGYYHIIGY